MSNPDYSITSRSSIGVPLADIGMVKDPAKILTRLVKQDHGLEDEKKQSLFAVFNKPEVLDTLLVGAAGAALTHAVASYMQVPTPARTLLSLAGFGIGNIIYNTLSERKFTTYDSNRGTVRMKI
jgi:hypothetical protein